MYIVTGVKYIVTLKNTLFCTEKPTIRFLQHLFRDFSQKNNVGIFHIFKMTTRNSREGAKNAK